MCRPRSPSATDVPGNAAPALSPRPRPAVARRGAVIVTGALAGWLATAAPAADTPRAGITVHDDQGREVTLPHPARRAITITPHATELVYAAGAGRYLAGTAQGSDHPPDARALPSIGDAMRPSLESAAALRPDLLIAWQPTHPDPLGDLMRRMGVPVYYSDPRTLSAIPDAVQAMGRLFGTEARATPAAARLRARLRALSDRYAGRPPVRVFIQAGLQPVYTLNGASIVSDAVRLCGGVNVFAQAGVLAPQVSVESVLAARPDAVLVGTVAPQDTHASLAAWQRHGLPAALQGHVYGLDADSLYRPGPRLVDAAERLCDALEQTRQASR